MLSWPLCSLPPNTDPKWHFCGYCYLPSQSTSADWMHGPMTSLLQCGEELHVSKTVWENNPPKGWHIHRKLPNISSLLCTLAPAHWLLSVLVCSDELWQAWCRATFLYKAKEPAAGLKGSYFGSFSLRATPKPCWKKPLGGKWSASMVRGNLVPPDLPLPPTLQVWGWQIEKPLLTTIFTVSKIVNESSATSVSANGSYMCTPSLFPYLSCFQCKFQVLFTGQSDQMSLWHLKLKFPSQIYHHPS